MPGSPGRCIVVLDHHGEHVEDLDRTTYSDFFDDVRVVARVVREALDVPRANLAVLGNKEAHVHAHVFPRGGTDDPVPDRSPWSHPEPEGRLAADELRALGKQISDAIGTAPSAS